MTRGRLLLLVGALAIVPVLAYSQAVTLYQQLVSVGSATPTAAKLTNTTGLTLCRGTLEGAPARVTMDGTTPTITVGQPMNTGDQIKVKNAGDIQRLQMIATTGVTATLNLLCSGGTTPDVSEIIPAPNGPTGFLPPCNPLTRPYGNCR